MAKRQNFVVGSTNPVTVTKTQTELNNGWNKYEVLKAGDLDGVFNAVSDYSNDSSQEIANAIQMLTGAQPTGASQNELAGALQQMREDIETSSLTFKGYVATSAPSSSTYGLVEGNIWINASVMPTTFPVSASSIRVWNGTSWATTTDTYTVKDFDFFRNINDGEGYYWFGGQWVVMSTDMSTTYFTLNQTSGKWEIKSSVNLPGAPTTTTPTSSSPDNQIATKKYVDEAIAPLPKTTYFPDVFDQKWSDYILSNPRWLRADDFAWHNSSEGPVAYQHLTDDFVEADWSPATQNANLRARSFWHAIAWDGNKFVAIEESGYISTSTDGTNWTPAIEITNLIGGGRDWVAIAWDGNKFVAIDYYGRISTSTDGTTWTLASYNTNLGSNRWQCVAWDGNKFVAIGDTGYISTSTDGTTWTTATANTNLGSHSWRAIAWDGNKFVALGNTGYISTSTDGVTWSVATANTNLGSNKWQGVVWVGNKFVAIGYQGYISTSTDGTTWTTATANTNLGTHLWNAVAPGSGKIVALDDYGYISTIGVDVTETIAGTTITYRQAPDGHKICAADQESNVLAIYNATGVAWYYILDTENQRFKLPRVNPDKEQLLSSAPVLAQADSSTYNVKYRIAHNISGSVVATGYALSNNGSSSSYTPASYNEYADLSNGTGSFSGKKYLYFYNGSNT